MQLFALMSSPEFLFASEANHELFKSLLEAFNAIVEYQYESMSHACSAICPG